MIFFDIDIAKKIAHEVRRKLRSKEFAPLDVKATIPFEAESAEIERQKVRKKYDDMQRQIDSSITIEEIHSAIQKK